MTRVRVHNFTISLDGYGAGPRQTREEPLGVGGEALHDWYIQTRTFQRMTGKSGGTTGVDDEFAARFGDGVGAWIMGRNMFGPIRGAWPDDAWRGWWGKNPPYHGPVFVLTHHSRPPEEMEGGTVVQIGGGVATIRQYLEASLIDEWHVAIAPRSTRSRHASRHRVARPRVVDLPGRSHSRARAAFGVISRCA